MKLSLVFWEITKGCNLNCPHCRAKSSSLISPQELTSEEAKRFIRELSEFAKPILVFSGGEPLLRVDIYELIAYARQRELKPAIATNATLISEDVAKTLKTSGVKLIAVSMYGSTEAAHDRFCGEPGVFNQTLKGIENIRKTGLPFQINTTITKKNISELERMADFSLKQGACAYHIFFLVPTGRAIFMEGDQISPQEYEQAFKRIYKLQTGFPLNIKVTCAPHYYRILQQKGQVNSKTTKGCLAADGVCFISYKGEVFGCGYLPLTAGNLRKQSFKDIWLESELFKVLRDESKLEGKCGVCEFKSVCGGCRARAYASTGNYLTEEPECLYQPLTVKS